MTPVFAVAKRRFQNILVLELSGRLIFDEDGDRVLREEVTAAVAAGERAILLDLNGVHQMDSGGVGILVAVYLHTAKRGGQLKLLRPSERVARVLHTTHLESAFQVFDDEAKAAAAFAPV